MQPLGRLCLITNYRRLLGGHIAEEPADLLGVPNWYSESRPIRQSLPSFA